MNNKNYAPVIIPTLNRYDHFKKCLESLERCTGADKTEVFVGLDYPPSDKYVDGWKKIDLYLQEKEKDNGFKRLVVFRRDHNCGVLNSNSNASLLTRFIIERFERYIFSEDDNEFSPNFLEYINTCLDAYESDQNVIAVCGYSYPIDWKVSEGATCLKENVSVPMFGVGFWTNKVKKCSREMAKGVVLNSLRRTIKNKRYNRMIDACKREFFDATCMRKFWKKNSNNLFCCMTDFTTRAYLAIEGKYVIAPILSKVRNHGFDGSGSCCQKIDDTTGNTAGTYDYEHQPIDQSPEFILIEDSLQTDEENRQRMNAFDVRTPEQMAKTNRLIWLCEHVGIWAAKLYCMLTLPFEALPIIIKRM